MKRRILCGAFISLMILVLATPITALAAAPAPGVPTNSDVIATVEASLSANGKTLDAFNRAEATRFLAQNPVDTTQTIAALNDSASLWSSSMGSASFTDLSTAQKQQLLGPASSVLSSIGVSAIDVTTNPVQIVVGNRIYYAAFSVPPAGQTQVGQPAPAPVVTLIKQTGVGSVGTFVFAGAFICLLVVAILFARKKGLFTSD